jgi:uncharacterized membrane protein YfcA
MNIIICAVTFISEYLDSGIGMGYGTLLSPVLIIMGLHPLQVVPAVLISQFFTDIAACISHHNCRNVNLKISSPDFKTASVIGLLSSLGVVLAVFIALRIPKWLLCSYIGILVIAMGVLILITAGRPLRFSWGKIFGLSFLAAFNKGISGGGYGPLIMGGQILSGVNAKNAVGITAFAEAITCLVGFIVYLVLGRMIDWGLITWLVISAIPAVPFAAITVQKMDLNRYKNYVGICIIVLGVFTLFRISSGG